LGFIRRKRAPPGLPPGRSEVRAGGTSVEAAACRLIGSSPGVCSSRSDAGVHDLRRVAHAVLYATLSEPLSDKRLQIQGELPPEVWKEGWVPHDSQRITASKTVESALRTPPCVAVL